MKFHLNKFIILFALTVSMWGCECQNPLAVDDRFLEKDSLADFAPPSAAIIPDTNNFSFLVISDLHYGYTPYQFFKYIEDNKAAWGDIKFVVVLGDITESGTQAQYDLAKSDMAQTTLKIYPVIGNHDLLSNGFNIYKYAFGRTVYTFTIGNIRFVFLDTANGTLGSYQRTWLESVLAQSVSVPTIVFSHFSPVDEGFQTFVEMSYPKERYYIYDLFERMCVDYYICGHLHLNDDVTIRGARYMIIKNISDGIASGTMLKVTVQNGTISCTYL